MLVTLFILMILVLSTANAQEKKVKILLKDDTEYLGKIAHEDSLNVTVTTHNNLTIIIPRYNIAFYDTSLTAIYSQNFDRNERVKITHNDTVTIGYIISHDAVYCLVELENNDQNIIKILTNDIEKIEPYKKESKPGDPNRARLLFAPTARSIPAGNVSFTIFELFFPALSVGIGDIVSLNGGISILPGLSEFQLIYAAAKVTFFQSDMFSAAAGFGYASTANSSFVKDGALVYYGIGTYGNEDNSITFGGGYFGSTGNNSKSPLVILLGGELRASKSVKFITENYIVPTNDFTLISVGLRFFGEHLAGDFGLFRPFEKWGESFFFPWVGFGYTF